jgi:nucleotide-binding universal stress UspA family protein
MIQKILIATDFSDESTQAFTFVKEQQDLYPALQTVALSVLENPNVASVSFELGLMVYNLNEVFSQIEPPAKERLTKLCLQHGIKEPFTAIIRKGEDSTAKEIINCAVQQNCDLIVLATHGRTGIEHAVIGSIAEKVLRESPIPVAVIPTREGAVASLKETKSNSGILILTDFSSESYSVFEIANKMIERTKPLNPHVTLLNVLDDITQAAFSMSLGIDVEEIWNERQAEAERLIEETRNRYFPQKLIDSAVIRQTLSIADEITLYARTRNIGLIILGSHGRTGFKHLVLGSVAEKVVRLASCPVLVVPVKSAIV